MRTKAFLLFRIINVSLFILSSVLARNARAAGASDESQGIFGTWRGVYYAFPNVMEFEMSVTRSSGMANHELTGTVSFFPSQTAKPITITQGQGKFAFNGHYEPGMRHFRIQAKKWMEAPSPGYRRSPPPMSGVYDEASDSLAGIFAMPSNDQNGDRFFICVRASDQDQLDDFIRRISGVAAQEANVEKRRLSENEEKQQREEQRSALQKLNSYKPEINAANAKVSSAERAMAQTERTIAAKQRGIDRLDGLIAKGGRSLVGNQRNRDLMAEQLVAAQQKLAGQTAELKSAKNARDSLLDRIAKENPALKEPLAQFVAGRAASTHPGTPTRSVPGMKRELPVDWQARRAQQAKEAERMFNAFVAWASVLKEKYPERELKAYAFTVADARNLFLPDHFRKHFGMTYAEMDDASFKAVRDLFNWSHSRDPEFSPYVGLSRQFTPRLPENYALHIYARAQPILAAWLDEMRIRLQELKAGTDAFDQIALMESAMEPFLQVCWPDAQTNVRTLVEATRTGLADQILGIKTDELVATAKGYAGAAELSRWGDKWPDVFRHASSESRKNHGARVTAKLDELVAPLLDAEIGKIESFGQGRMALEAGSDWYRRYVARYAFAAYRPRYREGLRLLGEQRKRELPRAQRDLIQEISLSHDAESVNRLSRALLVVPGDLSTDAGKAILAAADRRLARLDAEKLFSDYEMSLLQDGEVLVPAQPHEPTVEEIGLAYAREVCSVMDGQVLDHATARITTPVAKIFNFYLKVTVHGIEKKDWSNGNRSRVTLPNEVQQLANKLSERDAAKRTAVHSGDGYWCIYTLQLKFTPDDQPSAFDQHLSEKWDNPLLLGLFSSLSGEVVVDKFELTKSGWRSPTARQRLHDRQMGAIQAAAKDARLRCISCNGTGRGYGYEAGRMYSHPCWTCGGTGRQ